MKEFLTKGLYTIQTLCIFPAPLTATKRVEGVTSRKLIKKNLEGLDEAENLVTVSNPRTKRFA